MSAAIEALQALKRTYGVGAPELRDDVDKILTLLNDSEGPTAPAFDVEMCGDFPVVTIDGQLVEVSADECVDDYVLRALERAVAASPASTTSSGQVDQHTDAGLSADGAAKEEGSAHDGDEGQRAQDGPDGHAARLGPVPPEPTEPWPYG
jgi:hypothetical protein